MKPVCYSLTGRQQSVLLGTLLGDGYLLLGKGAKTPFFGISHGAKQLEYLKWKVRELAPLFNQTEPRSRTHPNSKISYYLYSRRMPVLRGWYEEFYARACTAPGINKKVVARAMLDRLDDLALALWFGDDGTRKRNHLVLVMGGLPECEYQLIQKWFEDQGLHGSLQHGQRCRRLVFDESSTQALVSRVKPHFHPDLMYKLPGGR